MSGSTGTLSTAPFTDPGLDYVALCREGTTLVQAMSGQIWTDYNFSDPGVTILEQLCYALTELSYRAEFPVPDLLGEPGSGRLHLRRQGLYPPQAILPCNPVTPDDFSRVLLDRVPGLRNAWFTPLSPDQAGGCTGLYDLALLVSGADPCCTDPGPSPAALRSQALDCYTAHRALGEDITEARVLVLTPTRISAEVQLEDGADPATVLAALLFALGLFLTPEPKRRSLDQMLAEGYSSAEIFSGPLMLRGFIANDQLSPLAGLIAVDDLLQIMAETQGVLAVEDLSVQVGDRSIPYLPGAVIEPPDQGLLSLVTGPRQTIRLLRGAVECRPNPARVALLLARRWQAQRQTYPLWSAYQTAYAAPVGHGWDLAAYSSVQDQFPNVYGINAYGLPPDSGPARRGQAKQLKGYLMPFDQLMADYFSQLAFLRALFSIKAGGAASYAWQSLIGIVPDVAPLLHADYTRDLAALVAASDPVVPRQSAILDLLLSLYAETVPMPPHAACLDQADSGAARLRAQRALLSRVVPATRDRGRGLNYRRAGGETGMAITARIELALLDASGGEGGAVTVPDPAEASFGRKLPPEIGAAVARVFLAVDDPSPAPDEPAASPLAGRRIAAALLPALAYPGRYRSGILPGTERVCLTCCDLDGDWWWLGDYHGKPEAGAAMARLMRAADSAGQRQNLTIIDWVLLRFALPPVGTGDASLYDFRLTAVLAASRDQADDADWQAQVMAILRRNAPAHIQVDCRLFARHRWRRFDQIYQAWRAALREANPARRSAACRRLQHFLEAPSDDKDDRDGP